MGTFCAKLQASFQIANNKDRDAAMMKPLHLSLACLIRVLAHSAGVFAPQRRESRRERRSKLSPLFPPFRTSPPLFRTAPPPRLNRSRISTRMSRVKGFLLFPRFSKHRRAFPKLALLINRNYTLLWLGGTISLIGNVLLTMMLILWVDTLLRNQSAAPLAVSGVVLAAALPALLIGPFAGVFVDRWPKQRTMRIMDALRAVLVRSLLPISGPLPLPLAVRLTIMYLVVAAVSGPSQFFTPATMAILKEVVPQEQLTRASALTVGAGVSAGPSGLPVPASATSSWEPGGRLP